MTKIDVRGAALWELTDDEKKQFTKWAWDARSRTTFDAGIIGYPRCAMLITENDNGPTAYLPLQTVLMAEAFIPKPDSSNKQKALSLGRLDQALVESATVMGIGDVYCYVPSQEADYAHKIQQHGWEEVPGVRLFKKRTGVTTSGEEPQCS